MSENPTPVVNPPQADLKPRIRSAYRWSIAGNLAKQAVGFGISMLLARLLQRSDFGLIAMTQLVVAFLTYVQDLGVADAVVHFNEDESALPTYYTVTALMGTILTALLLAAAPLAALFFREPRLTPILRVLSASLLLGSLQSVSKGLMTKTFRFRELTIRDVVSTTAGGTVGVAMAFLGYGVWSLVANLILWNLLQTALVLYMKPPRFTRHIRRDVLRRILNYGLPMTGASMLFQFYDNADFLIVGRVLGSDALGLYNMAFKWATMANEKVGVVINQVASPSFAAMQDNTERVREHWFAVSRRLLILILPILAFLFVNSPDGILLLPGKKWLPAVVPLRYLCAVGAVRSLVSVMGRVFVALGRTRLQFRIAIANLLVMPPAFWVGCRLGGINGVAMAWCLAYPVLWIYTVVLARGVVPFSILAYFRNLRMPVFTAVSCALAMEVAGWPLQVPIWRLAVRSLVGGATFLTFVLASDGELRQRAMALLHRKPPAES
jgi:PST family polysaccharide transporter